MSELTMTTNQTNRRIQADILVTNHGSIVQFWPLTPEATAWADENVQLESWQWMGQTFNMDWRYADPLLTGMSDAGLHVEINQPGMED